MKTRSLALVSIALRLTALLAIAGAAAPVPVWAQQAASLLKGAGRFENTKKWKGSFTLTGSGGVQTASDTYSLSRSVSGSFTLTLQFSTTSSALYTGSSGALVSVNDKNVHFDPIYGTSSSTYQGSGVSTDPVEFHIDEDSCNYSLSTGGQIPVVATFIDANGSSSSATTLYGWSSGNGLGIRDISLPESGRTLSGSNQFTDGTGDWHVAWTLEGDRDRDLGVKAYSQGDPVWRTELLDHSTSITIKQKGCALTSLAMGMGFAGFPINPGELNFTMKFLGGFLGRNVNWPVATDKASNGLMKFHGFRSGSTGAIDDVLCMGFPVIAGVKFKTVIEKGKPVVVPGHFVIVTGRQGNEFFINDPAGAHTQLSQYGAFETRGFVTDATWNANPNHCGGPPPLQASATTARNQQAAAATVGDKSALTISADNNVELLVIDPNGKRTGHDGATGDILEEIPGSV